MGFKIIKTQEELNKYMEEYNVKGKGNEVIDTFWKIDVEKDNFDFSFLDKYDLHLTGEDYKKCNTAKDIWNLPISNITKMQIMIDYYVEQQNKIHCSKCGNLIGENDNYCGNCGQKLK